LTSSACGPDTLTPEERASLDARGYLVLGPLVSPPEISTIVAQIDAAP